MSIAANAPWLILKLRRSAMLLRPFMGTLVPLSRTHWDHEPQTENPKGIPPQSPGLPSVGQSGSDRGYPGFEASEIYNPGCANLAPSIHGNAWEVSNILRLAFGTAAFRGLEIALCRCNVSTI